jgi:hypothetical protein
MADRPIRRILLVQLPIPPSGAESVVGNVPLAAAFLKLYARRQGFERDFEIDIFPPNQVDTLGDQGLLEAILQREPDAVGFTCFVWNVERSLWLAEQIKLARPDVKIVLGGPEITADNRWATEHRAVDRAIFGEGEAAFGQLLASFRDGTDFAPVRCPLENLDAVDSPYLEGIMDVAPGETMFLETVRGCRFRCKYCYYAKSDRDLRFLSADRIEANVRYAVERGAGEIFLLDPTINQRPDFDDFLRLLALANPERKLAFSGELRAEGIDRSKAELLRAANFTELEIGLQSVEPAAQRLMNRPVNLDAWASGVRALMATGIRVRLDLILGLPGDSADSIRRGIDFLSQFRPEAEMQIFNLSILPGTAFRAEADNLQLKYQAKPPYYVFQTPTLDADRIFSLMEEAQSALGVEFDKPALPTVEQRAEGFNPSARLRYIDLDDPNSKPPLPTEYKLVTTLHLRSADFSLVENRATQLVAEALRSNPHITLQIVLEPLGDSKRLRFELLEEIFAACYASTSYLDRFYSLQPGHLLGAKRLFVLLAIEERSKLGPAWIEAIAGRAHILWHGNEPPKTPLAEYESFLSSPLGKRIDGPA